ncbi:MAG: T9SS type A sorting domain-containing protein [Bacteroidota bacterium]
MKKITTLTTILVMLFCMPLFSQTAPNFTITATDGQQYRLHDDFLNNGKTVLIKIFFTSCPFCNSIAPATEVLYQDWGGGSMDVEFIALSDKAFDDNNDVAMFEDRHALTYLGAGSDGGALDAIVPYKDGRFGRFFGTPTFVVIAPDGSVNFNVRGSNNDDTIDKLDQAIAATGARRPTSVSQYDFSGQVRTTADVGIEGVNIRLSNSLATQTTGTDGSFSFQDVAENIPIDLGYSKSGNPLASVSTYDLVLLSKHILDIEPFNSPYKAIASDVNGSGTLSAFDIIEIRKLILGLIDEFPIGQVWRFVPSCVTFSDPNKPFDTANENCIPQSFLDQDYNDFNIIGIKLGDPSTVGVLSSSTASEGRSQGSPFQLIVEDRMLEAGQSYRIPIKSGAFSQLAALQFGLKWNQQVAELQDLSFEGSESALAVKAENFNLTQKADGKMSFAWFDVEAHDLAADAVLFYLDLKPQRAIKLSDLLSLDASLTRAEASRMDGSLLKIALDIETDVVTNQIQLSPSPASNWVQIQLNQAVEQQIALDLYDLQGRKIRSLFEGRTQKGQQQLDISVADIPNGLYLVRMLHGKEQCSLKLLIAH